MKVYKPLASGEFLSHSNHPNHEIYFTNTANVVKYNPERELSFNEINNRESSKFDKKKHLHMKSI